MAFHESKVVFNWEQRNRTFAMRGRPASWKTMGQITFVTEKDDDFQPVTCIAETDATKQRLEINIKRLRKYLCTLLSATDRSISGSSVSSW